MTSDLVEYDWNALATNLHKYNFDAGWWDPWPNKHDRWPTARLLTASELTEAMEGWRKDLDDDHLPKYKMFPVELADTAIRLLDMAGAYGISLKIDQDRLDRLVADLRPKTIPERLDRVVEALYLKPLVLEPIELAFWRLLAIADLSNVDLITLIFAKWEYNKVRADHKRENRNKAGGKKI